MKKAKIIKLTLSVFMTVVLAFAVLTLVACESKHEHTYGEWETVTEASCAKAGLKKRVCSECDESTEGHVEESPILALVHAYGQWTVTQEATCTEDGEEKRVCRRCDESVEGHEQTSRIAARGHRWTNVEVTVEPMFNSVGEKVSNCNCGETKIEELSETGVPAAFRGTWVADNCRDIVISTYELDIVGLEIVSWNGEGNVITVITLYEDEEVEITLTLSEDGRTLTSEDNGNSYEFIKPASWHNVNIILSNTSLGEYTLSGEAPYYEGEEVVLTVTPIEGYEVSNVTLGVNPIPREPDGTYIITVGDFDPYVTVIFSQKTGGDSGSSQEPAYAKEDYVGYWTNFYSRVEYVLQEHSLSPESYLDVSISGDGLSVVVIDDQGQELELYFELEGNVYVDNVNNYEMYMEIIHSNQPSIVLTNKQINKIIPYEKSSGLDIPDEYYGYWASQNFDIEISITKSDIYLYVSELNIPIVVATVNQGAEGGFTFTWEGVTYIVTSPNGDELTVIVNGQTRTLTLSNEYI